MEDIEGYKTERLTIDLVKANLFGIFLIIPIIIVYGIPFYFIWGNNVNILEMSMKILDIGSLRILLIMVFGIIIHEVIHGLTWAKFAKNGFKSIKFGILWKMITPYCHCKEPLKVKHYIIGALTPGIILGIIPAIISLFIGNIGVMIFSVFFTMAAAGDIMVVNLLKNEDKDNFVQDHPSEAGCYIYRKIENQIS